MHHELSLPSEEQARQFLREVRWSERLDGELFHPGPGELREYIYRLQDAHTLLNALDMFRIDLDRLTEWVRVVLGDEELASALTAVRESEHRRAETVDLLGLRIQQCTEVLGASQATK